MGGRDGRRRRGKCGERKERKGPVLHLRGAVPRRVSRSSSLRPRRRGVAGCSWHRNYSANYRVAFPNPAHGPRRPSRPISSSICPNASISLPAIPRQSAGESPDNSHGDRREKGGGGETGVPVGRVVSEENIHYMQMGGFTGEQLGRRIWKKEKAQNECEKTETRVKGKYRTTIAPKSSKHQ